MKRFFWVLACAAKLTAYHEPQIDLGFHNILDGGSLLLTPGWFWEEFPQYYHSSRFLDGNGKTLGGVPSPSFNLVDSLNEIFYQSDQEVLFKGNWSALFVLPTFFYSHVSPNTLGITSSGAGVGDLYLGLSLQWNTIYLCDRPLFKHRLSFNASFPTGMYHRNKSINPGNGFFFINPYWAATIYPASKWALSWRLYYLWNATNPKNHIQAGQAIHFNYSITYECVKDLWAGIVGYFLQQFNDDKLHGISVPNSKERVFAIGPGALYSLTSDLSFFLYLYFETNVRNRPEGVSLIGRFFYHF